MPFHIALFASGTGSNVLKIIEHFKTLEEKDAHFSLYCNKPDAGILERIQAHPEVPIHTFDKKSLANGSIKSQLQDEQVQLIVLAGFLWLIPSEIVSVFPQRIINIHPSLLPAHGGKGMYGMKVHQAVIENKESRSGITIHHVNERYDEGYIILQAMCEVSPEDSPDSLRKKVQQLEHQYFPLIIEEEVERLQRI